MAKLTCYRGEKVQWWPAPGIRLMYGMTLFEPWDGNIKDLWAQLKADIENNGNRSVDGYAQYLRAQGRPYALATARTIGGSFGSDYNYQIEIDNAKAFLWAGDNNLALGDQVDNFVSNASAINEHYIVLNADRIVDSTVLGFGHNTGTKELTFFHGLPQSSVKLCNNKAITVKNISQLKFEEKMKYQKILQPIQTLVVPKVSGPASFPVPHRTGEKQSLGQVLQTFRDAHYPEDE